MRRDGGHVKMQAEDPQGRASARPGVRPHVFPRRSGCRVLLTVEGRGQRLLWVCYDPHGTLHPRGCHLVCTQEGSMTVAPARQDCDCPHAAVAAPGGIEVEAIGIEPTEDDYRYL